MQNNKQNTNTRIVGVEIPQILDNIRVAFEYEMGNTSNLAAGLETRWSLELP